MRQLENDHTEDTCLTENFDRLPQIWGKCVLTPTSYAYIWLIKDAASVPKDYLLITFGD